jgi:cell division septum initiation protein DivIVA
MSNKFSSIISDIQQIVEASTLVNQGYAKKCVKALDDIDSEITQLQNENERLMQRNDAQRILIQTLYQDLDNTTNIDDAVKNGMVKILQGLIAQLKGEN